MNNLFGKLCLVGFFFCCFLNFSSGQGTEQKNERDPKITKVLEDWKQRRTRAKTVRYTWQGTLFFPKHAIVQQKKNLVAGKAVDENAKDVTLIDNGMLLIHFATNRYRLERDKDYFNITTGIKTKNINTATFDGESTWGKRRELIGENAEEVKRAGASDVLVHSGNLDNVPMDLNLLPLFLGHGIVVMGVADAILPGKMFFDPDISTLTVRGQGVHDGRPCLVLRSSSRDPANRNEKEYWIDTERDSAVLRIIQLVEDFPTSEFDISYQTTAAGWLVKAWTLIYRSHSPSEKTPMTRALHKFHIKDLLADIPVKDSDFKLEIEPGMLLRRVHETAPPKTEERKKKRPMPGEYFRVDEKGEEHPVSSQLTTRGLFLWIALALGAIAITALLLCWRAKK